MKGPGAAEPKLSARVGTAGWSIPRAIAEEMPGSDSHLERYARVLNCAEINSSFHRPHRAEVYAKWAARTPDGFRFSVKAPRTISHDAQLKRCRPMLDTFLSQVAGLGGKLGPLLIQLPPSLELSTRTARAFFALLRERHAGSVVCEPRHATWFTAAAGRVFEDFRIARVATDPSPIAAATQPGGWRGEAGSPGEIYYRLHGSPRKYWSRYPAERIAAWAAEMRDWMAKGAETWCIFDNTASGAAMENALEMLRCASPPDHSAVPPGRGRVDLRSGPPR